VPPIRAILRGLSTALSSPTLVLGLWLLGLLFALPLSWMVASALESDLGASRVQESLRHGFDMDWYSEFEGRARGLATTFEPSRLVGVGPFLDNLEGWVSGQLFQNHPAIVGFGAVFGLAWILCLGGVLDRLSNRARGFGLEPFFESGGRLFGRLLRLALISAPFYYGIYRLSRWALQRIADSTQDQAAELPRLAGVVAATLAIALLLHLLRMIFDYAKVALVVEDRRSSLGAALSGASFVLRNPIRTLSVDLGFVLLSVILLWIYHWIAPGTGQSTVFQLILATLVMQLFLILRIFVRLALLSAELELYRFVERR
jgi:hypothetical protein